MALFGFGRKKSAQGGSLPAGRQAPGGKEPAPTVATVQPAQGKKETHSAAVSAPAPRSSAGPSFSHILKNPRITEKATMRETGGVYTFDVAGGATKQSIAHAVVSLYKVTPRKVCIVTIPSKRKRNMRTGTRGATRGGKKAYVYLKKGESITIS